MDVCRATKRNGEPCTLPANGPHGFCWAHDPANAEARRRGASRGGRARARRELPEIKQEVRDVIEGVLGGRIPRDVGAVAFQGFNTLLRAVEVERKAREQEEIEARI